MSDRELFIRSMAAAGGDPAATREALSRMDEAHAAPKDQEGEGFNLGRWVDRLQRQAEKHPDQPVTAHRFAMLATMVNALHKIIVAMNAKNRGRNARLDAIEARLGGTAAAPAADADGDDDLLEQTRALIARIEAEGDDA